MNWPLGRPVPVNGLKFRVKAPSPEPAMVRHLCAAGAAARSTAAGVAAATTVATITHANTAKNATQRVVRRGSRIGLSCLSRPGLGRLPKTECPEAFPEPFHVLGSESSPSVRKLRELIGGCVPER